MFMRWLTVDELSQTIVHKLKEGQWAIKVRLHRSNINGTGRLEMNKKTYIQANEYLQNNCRLDANKFPVFFACRIIAQR
jgi:hypothetical protein